MARQRGEADFAVQLGAAAVAERIAARFNDEIETLQGAGATVVSITPDEASVDAFGPNLMDFRRRADAARAGIAQGLAYAEQLAPFWI